MSEELLATPVAFDAHDAPPVTAGGSAAVGASNAPGYVYAVGRIEARFPNLSVEKEFIQATGRAGAARLTQDDALAQVLSDPANRYLVRQLCWVLAIEGLDCYVLQPQDSLDFEMLVNALRPSSRSTDMDAVIGYLGPLAPQEMCNGLALPILVFHQIYSFDIDALVASLPVPDGLDAELFRASVEEVVGRILQIADNSGASDEHRALNYLALRYPAIFKLACEQHAKSSLLAGIEVRASRLSGARVILDVIFTYRNALSDVTDAFFCRVDVTEEFPFLATKLAPYFDR